MQRDVIIVRLRYYKRMLTTLVFFVLLPRLTSFTFSSSLLELVFTGTLGAGLRRSPETVTARSRTIRNERMIPFLGKDAAIWLLCQEKIGTTTISSQQTSIVLGRFLFRHDVML